MQLTAEVARQLWRSMKGDAPIPSLSPKLLVAALSQENPNRLRYEVGKLLEPSKYLDGECSRVETAVATT